MTRRTADEPQVHRITGARRSHTEDLDRRINRYLISMAVRTICVIGVFVVPGPARWVLVVGAVFLPYVAVLLANATDRRSTAPPPAVDHRSLTAVRSCDRDPDPAPTVPGTVVQGRIVSGPPPSTEPTDPPT